MTASVGVVSAAGPTTYSATDNVEVWERAPLPLRVSTADATKTITNGAMDVEVTKFNTGPVPIRKSEIGVYQPGNTVSTSFDSVTGAGTSTFAGNDTQLVIARLEPDSDSGASMDMIPGTIGEAEDLLEPDKANGNATFWVKDTGTIDSTGSLTTDVTFDQSGTYMLFLATGNAFSAPTGGGDISVTGDATVVGMDAAIVEQSAANVNVASSQIKPGNDASFTVNTGATDTNVSVLVYKKSTLVNSETVYKIDGPINSDLSGSDVTIQHSISEVNGVKEFDGPVTILGSTFNDNQVGGTTSSASIIEYLVDTTNDERDGSDIEQPNTQVIGSGDRLDASVIGKSGVDGSVTINVPTYNNWSEGKYKYVVTTGGKSAGDIHTATGSIKVKTSSGGGGGGGGGDDPDDDDGGDDDGDDDDDDDDSGGGGGVLPPAPPADTPRVVGAGQGSTVTKTDGRISVNLTSAAGGSNVEIDVPADDNEVNETGYGMSGMNLNFNQNSSGSIDVSKPAEATAGPVSETGDVGYFEITHTVPNENVGSATYEFSVSQQRLEERGLGPEDISLYRYEEDGWRELETRYIGITNGVHQFEADSPGLSLYAISERNQAQPDFQVTDASVGATDVEVGDTVEVTATIENQGSASGEYTATLEVDGSGVAEETVQLDAGEETTVTFSTSFDEAGDYTVSVDGVEAGTVSVTEPEDETTTTTEVTTTTETTTTAGPGDGDGGTSPLVWFGILVALALFAAGIYLNRMK